MNSVKTLSFTVMMLISISASHAATPVVANDSLSVSGFDFSDENALQAKDIYGACYRLEEPIFIDLSAEGHGVAGKLSWVSKVRFTLAQSKVIDSMRLSARDTPDGVSWLDEGIIPGTRLHELGMRKDWITYLGSTGRMTNQSGWEVKTIGVNNNIVRKRVNIPTRNLQTLEFIFESQANKNDVHIMFERQPGTNYMKNTSVWWPENGASQTWRENDSNNKLLGTGNWMAPYTGFNLVRTERISFQGRQYNSEPSQIKMGAYEVNFKVEPDTEKYGFTAAQYDAACQ